ncbi:MAG: hypothetical protein KGO81_02835 [Bacteroidota bacterium]|nr:hypothetical protein [Bacteroidota bacterium]
MNKSSHRRKLIAAAFLVFAVHTAFAAFIFTGIADENTKSNKYSLKNLSSYTHRGLSLASIRSGMQFSGLQVTSQQASANSMEFNSILQFDRGNSSYVFPYKFKVKVPKFKTPSPVNH